jgi:hypothetical protein
MKLFLRKTSLNCQPGMKKICEKFAMIMALCFLVFRIVDDGKTPEILTAEKNIWTKRGSSDRSLEKTA